MEPITMLALGLMFLMVILTIGTPLYDYLNNPVITYETEEGDFVTADRIVWSDGAKDASGAFSLEISRGNFIEVDSLSADGDIRVKAAVAGIQNLLGIAFQDPQTKQDEQLPTLAGTYDDSPGFPKVHREVAVEIFGAFQREVPLSGAGTTAALGGSIAPDSGAAHVWEGDAVANDTYVTKSGIPGTDATCVAVFGKSVGRF